MTQTLLQFLLTVLMYSLMGCMVGVGVVVFRMYPQIGTFVNQRPILGWTLVFAAGSIVLTAAMVVVEMALLMVLQAALR